MQPESRPRLLVIGDSNLDRWTVGPATRVNPEAPTLVIEPASVREGPGGAGAVAYIAAGLGAQVHLLTAIGADAAGESLRRMLFESGVMLIGRSHDKTTVKHRICAESNGHGLHPIIRIDENARVEHDSAHLVGWAFDNYDYDAVLVADYGRGVCSPELLAEVFHRADGLPVLVDPARGVAARNYVGASLIKMNREEAMTSSGRGARFTMTTLDRDGAELIDDDKNESFSAPSLATSVVDVTGAGDAILAALGVLVARSGGLDGIPPERLLRVAMRAAAAEVAQFGVSQVPVSVLEDEPVVKDSFTTELPDPVAALVYPPEVLAARLKDRRDCGQTVALVNGCFDQLHCGHLLTIFAAAEVADIIIVAINSDASVRRLKGPNRPIQPQAVRAAMLEAVKRVDYVVIFDDDTPLSVITAIRPDVLVRGDEPGKIVGEREMAEWGGKVVRVKKLDGFSTSATVERMKR